MMQCGTLALALAALGVAVQLSCALAKPEYGAETANAASSADGSAREPSCEELRAMWRFSKRQSRATEITNEIPTYRDPFAYNVWIPYATSRSGGGGGGGGRRKTHVYGRPVFEVPPRSREMARLFGAAASMPRGGATVPAVPRKMHTAFRLGGGSALSQMQPQPQSGSFQHLQKLIRAERARELQQQRVAEQEQEEQAARLQATANAHANAQLQAKYFGRMVQDPAPPAPPAALRAPMPGLVAFPDLLAPPLRYAHPEQYMQLAGGHQLQAAQSYRGLHASHDRHRSMQQAEPLSRTAHLERGFFHH